jgi:hypothetical protein
MSAAGISMFYASFDVGTARAETTASLDPEDSILLTAGMWTNTRIFQVLDLSRLPERPDYYARQRWDLDQLIFLEDFVKDITRPVVHDGREHIDYVPTQILTEYFRHVYKEKDSPRLDGIVYPSAQRKRGKSVVIFASHQELNPHPDGWRLKSKPLLELDTASIRKIRRR